MTDKDDRSKKGAPPAASTSPSGPKKPKPIIDLKPSGVEIKQDDNKTGASPDPAKTVASASQQQAAESPPPKPAAKESSAGASDPTGDKPAGASRPDPAQLETNKSDPKEGQRLPEGVFAGMMSTAFLTHLAAGCAGGLFVLIIGSWLASPFSSTPDSSSAATKFSARLAALEQRTKALPAAGDEASFAKRLARAETRLKEIARLSASLANLEQAQAKLRSETKSISDKIADGAPNTKLAARVSTLEDSFREIGAAAKDGKPAGKIQQLAALSGRLADLETALGNRITALRKSVNRQLEDRTNKIAATSEAARAGTRRMDRELAGLKSETKKVAGDVGRLDKSIIALRKRSDGLSGEMTAVKTLVSKELRKVARPADVTSAIKPLASKVSTLQERLASVVDRDTQRQDNAKRILLALELANLRRAVEAGGGYRGELDEVRRLAGDKLDLTALTRFSDTGVPTLGKLKAELRKIAHDIIAADSQPTSGTLLDRFVTSAKSIVRVRRVGANVKGDSAEAVVARMEAAMENGRLDKVVAASKGLSKRAMIPSAKSWLNKVEARAAAYTAIAAIEKQVKTTFIAVSGTDEKAK